MPNGDGKKKETPPREPTETISDYPNHTDSFEMYYYLGEMRTLKMAAFYRFQQLHSECPPSDPKYHSKFESFYTKFKRWARNENWSEWVQRKEIEERHKREAEARERLGSISRTLRGYQGLVRQSIIVFSDKVKASAALRLAVARGDEAEITKLATQERIEIKNFKEAKDMIELDIYLSRILDQQPEFPREDRGRLDEEKEEKVDKLMEFLRKRSLDAIPIREEKE